MPPESSPFLKPAAFAQVPEPRTPSLALIYGENHNPAGRKDQDWNKQIETLISKIKYFCITHHINMIGEEDEKDINLLDALAEQIKVGGSRVNFMDYRKQSDEFFEIVKSLLERLYLLLSQPEIDLACKIKTLEEFLPSCIVCSTGLAMALSEAVNTLTPGNALLKTLANLRTLVIKQLAETFIAGKNIPNNMSAHTHREFLQFSITLNWNPSERIVMEQLHDEYFSNVTPEDLAQFHSDFLSNYSLGNIVERLTVELHMSVSRSITTFPLTLQRKRAAKTEPLTPEEINEETGFALDALRGNSLAEEFFPKESNEHIYTLKEDQVCADLDTDISEHPISQEETYPGLPIECTPANVLQPFILNGLAKKDFFTEEVILLAGTDTKRQNQRLHIIPNHPHFAYMTYETINAEEKTIDHVIPLENKFLERLIETIPEQEEISADFIATLSYAESTKHSPIIWAFLQKRHVDFTQSLNQADETPLQWAARNQNIDCILAFLECLQNRGSDWYFSTPPALLNLLAHIAEFGTIELIQKTIPPIREFIDCNDKVDNFLILPYAAKNPDVNCLNYFLNNFTDLTEPLQAEDTEGKTALDRAAEKGLTENVKALLEKHCQQSTFIFPSSAIDLALRNAHCECAWLLIQAALAQHVLDTHDQVQHTAVAQVLLLAVQQKNHTIICALLERIPQYTPVHIFQALQKCAPEDKETAEALLFYYINRLSEDRRWSYQDSSFLNDCATKGTVKVWETLFTHRDSLFRLTDTVLAELLSTAAEAGNTDVVQCICATHQNALQNQRTLNPGLTPLMKAAKNGHTNTVKILVKYGAEVDEKYEGKSAASLAIKNGHTVTAEVLLTRSREQPEFALNTPLHLAILTGNKTIVEKLLSSFSNNTTRQIMLNLSPHQKMSSFQKIQRQFFLLNDMLVTGLVGILANTERGLTIFMGFALQAWHSTYQHMRNKLHEERKKQALKTLTPLALAVSQGHEEVAKLLISYGANVNQALIGQQTPLEIAIKKGFVPLVKLLLDNGAEVLQKWQIRKTPLQLAKQTKNSEIITLIETKIAAQTAARNAVRQSSSTAGCFSFFRLSQSDQGRRDDATHSINEHTPLIPPTLEVLSLS